MTLFGYECLRSSSSSLFKADFGVDNLPWVMTAAPFLMIVALYAYGYILNVAGPRLTLHASMAISAILMFGCWQGVETKLRWASAILYVVREVYVVILIEQYWSFLNSTLSVKKAKWWNGPIVGISTIGSILGGEFTHMVAVEYGTPKLILFGAMSLLPAAIFSEICYRICGEPKKETLAIGTSEVIKRDPLHLSLFKNYSMLRQLLLIVILTQVVSTATSLAFERELQLAYPDRDLQTAYSGRFWSMANSVALVFQFIIAPFVLNHVPILVMHFLIVAANLLGCGFLLVMPSLTVAAGAHLIFKSLDYSLFRAAKELLYVPLSFDVRYRAKEVIDAFGYRFGKGLSSAGFIVVQSVGYMTESLYGWVAVASALGWLFGVRRLLKPKG